MVGDTQTQLDPLFLQARYAMHLVSWRGFKPSAPDEATKPGGRLAGCEGSPALGLAVPAGAIIPGLG